MRTDFVYPEVGDRRPPAVWEEDGYRDARERAQDRVREILGSHYPTHLDPALDAQVRSSFDIRLPSESMGPGSGRW
jgi:trimethylamine--corrinoid protein Co-methyltransferase